MPWLFLSAFGLGLAFCAPPGALTAEAIRRGLAGGFGPAFQLEVGSLVGDATWAAIALVGAAFLVQNAPMRLALSICGILILYYLGWIALRDAWTGAVPKAGNEPRGSNFAVGAMMSLSNPLSVAFWLGAGGGAVSALVPHPGPRDFVVFYVGFMLACCSWCLFFPSLVVTGRRLMRPNYFRGVNLVCGLVMMYFGSHLLLDLALVA